MRSWRTRRIRSRGPRERSSAESTESGSSDSSDEGTTGATPRVRFATSPAGALRSRAEVAAFPDDVRETTARQLISLLQIGPSVVRYANPEAPRGPSPNADLVIDGLLGYSARGAPRDPIADLIRAANSSATPILAVD